jgi:hypothetical protein
MESPLITKTFFFLSILIQTQHLALPTKLTSFRMGFTRGIFEAQTF